MPLGEGWGGVGSARGGGALDIIHGRSRMPIDPRIPTMPGRNTSGFHRPDTGVGGHVERLRS